MRLLINKIYSSVIRDGHTTLVIHVISDNSGYYLIGRGAPTFSIWKYLFSTPASSQCQEIPFSNLFGYGQLMISDTSFFLLTEDAASPYSVHFSELPSLKHLQTGWIKCCELLELELLPYLLLFLALIAQPSTVSSYMVVLLHPHFTMLHFQLLQVLLAPWDINQVFYEHHHLDQL